MARGRWLGWLLLLTAGACGPADEVGSESLDSKEQGVLAEGSREAYGVLAFLNSPNASVAVLDHEVGLTPKAAENIFAHVHTPTAKSKANFFDTVAELDAVPYVGPQSLVKLRGFAETNGWVPDHVVEGVALSNDDAYELLLVANTASVAALDDDVRLTSTAAAKLVSARPIETVEAVGAVAYIGPASLLKLRDYAVVQGEDWATLATHAFVEVFAHDSGPASDFASLGPALLPDPARARFEQHEAWFGHAAGWQFRLDGSTFYLVRSGTLERRFADVFAEDGKWRAHGQAFGAGVPSFDQDDGDPSMCRCTGGSSALCAWVDGSTSSSQTILCN